MNKPNTLNPLNNGAENGSTPHLSVDSMYVEFDPMRCSMQSVDLDSISRHSAAPSTRLTTHKEEVSETSCICTGCWERWLSWKCSWCERFRESSSHHHKGIEVKSPQQEAPVQNVMHHDEVPDNNDKISTASNDTDLEDDGVTLDDLHSQPTIIDEELGASISDWVSTIREYEELEEALLEKYGEELSSIIAELQNNPDSFLLSENSDFQSLAVRRKAVHRKQTMMRLPDVQAQKQKRHSITLSKHVLSEHTLKTRRASAPSVGSLIGKEELLQFQRSMAAKSTPMEPSEQLHSQRRILSIRWANRLAEVVPTQGALRPTKTKQGTIGLTIRPKWPEWLADVTYDVIKTNRYGKRQRRVLKLTEYHLLNIKNGQEITRCYNYGDVINAYLVNSKSLVLTFSTKTYHYECILAANIVQQVATRVQVRMALDKIAPSANPMTYSAESTAAMIQNFSQDRTADTSSNIVSFAKGLGERAMRRSNIGASTSNGHIHDDEWVRRLVSIAPDSAEHQVQLAVQKIMLDENTPEGNSTKLFIEKFLSNQNDILDLRLFIDGMQDYIMENHGIALCAMLSNDQLTFSSRPASIITKATKDNLPLTEEMLTVVSFIAFSVVEETLFFPLKDAIAAQLKNAEYRDKEKLLVHMLRELQSRPQTEWDINPEFISSNDWKAATFELAGIERNPTPSMRLNALVRTAKSIYAEFKSDVLPKLVARGKKDTVLGADDLLPIFIFVLCQSGLRTPLLNKELLWQLCHPDQLHGESGYYLTVYESAVEYVLNMEYGRNLDVNRLPDLESDSSDISWRFTNLPASSGDSFTSKLTTHFRRASDAVLETARSRSTSGVFEKSDGDSFTL